MIITISIDTEGGPEVSFPIEYLTRSDQMMLWSIVEDLNDGLEMTHEAENPELLARIRTSLLTIRNAIWSELKEQLGII